MVIDGNGLILIIGKKILFKKNSKSELSPKKKYARASARVGPGLAIPLSTHAVIYGWFNQSCGLSMGLYGLLLAAMRPMYSKESVPCIFKNNIQEL